MTRRVAVIGGGVSGLVAAYVLARDDSGQGGNHVTLYEGDDRLGGHADTHDVVAGDRTIAVDTGFIVHNERTYPTLLRLFDELGVRTQESDMSMSVVDQASGLEYAGALGVRGLFPSGRNLTNPRYLRMLTEISRFHRRARKVLASESADTTLTAFLDEGRFSSYFRKHFMTPLVACVWSCDPAVALDYPARYLFTFLEHHGMLTVFGSPTWRTVTGGSREYVDRVAEHIHEVCTGRKVTEVAETAEGVRVTDGSGASVTYDAVVIATHPDQALGMLSAPTDVQREVLGSIGFSDNVAQLHTDTSLLPRSDDARASWNYQRRAQDDGRVLVTYDMTRLMRIEGASERYLVTLNGTDIVDPDKVIATREYAHPIYDPTSVGAQQRLSSINTERVAFAGAWQGWGFHEDGALSGRNAAEHLGASWHKSPRVDGQSRRLSADASPTKARFPRPAGETGPPTPRIYDLRIDHARTAPVRNVFSYRSYTWLVDLDELPSVPGLARFEARDHIGDPACTLRQNIDAFLAEHDIDLDGGRVLMLSQARVLGHVFNPITVYWCHRADNELACVVVEVHNTYGGRHAYLVHPDEEGRARIDKELYVSPFNDTSGEYSLVVPLPEEKLRVSVTLTREGHPPFTASMRGTSRPAGRRSLIAAALRMPMAPLVAAARIRLQGIKLWARGLPVQPRPPSST